MESSKLKPNVKKTYLIIIGIKQQRNKIVDYFSIKILGSDTSLSDTVQNLGVVLNSAFISTFYKYVQVCKSCFYHIHDFHRIQHHLSLSSAKTISVALLNGQLDLQLPFK